MAVLGRDDPWSLGASARPSPSSRCLQKYAPIRFRIIENRRNGSAQNVTNLLQTHTDLAVSGMVDIVLWVNRQRVVLDWDGLFDRVYDFANLYKKDELLKISNILAILSTTCTCVSPLHDNYEKVAELAN